MKNLYIILVLLISIPAAISAVSVELNFNKDEIQQGSIETAVAHLSDDSLQKINLQKLKAQTIGDTLYIHSVLPPLRKEGSNDYESEFKVIFLKVPQSSQLVHKIENTDISIKWTPVKVNPTEVPEQLIFEQFKIPQPVELIKWIVGLIVTLILVFGFLKIKKERSVKIQRRLLIKSVKDSVLSANTYDEIVAIWKRKYELIQLFPALSSPFKEFETVLFKYQFRPYQSESDIDEIMKAYREFVKASLGGFDGI